jgi:hypothetical protein
MSARTTRPAVATALALIALFGSAREGVSQTVPAAAAKESGGMEMEVPHPFFTHEGLPDPVGTFSLRTVAVATRVDGKTQGDFGFHLETGLTKTIGLHIRNDGVLNSPRTEAMFQFAAITSGDGRSGFAPIVEFEFPTHSGAGSRINTLVGQTGKLANASMAFNEVVHYNPREDMAEWSASWVVVATPKVFPVVEIFGEGGTDALPIVRLLAGIKVRIREGFLLGLAYQLPITKNKEFSSQFAFQPDFDWSTGR